MFAGERKFDNRFLNELTLVSRPLKFISETDADVIPFTAAKPDSRSLAAYLAALGIASNEIDEVEFDEFFRRLTSEKDWHGPSEKKRAKQFSKLRDLLRGNLKDLRVIRVGRVRLDIYIVGVDAGGGLAGVKTKAIET